MDLALSPSDNKISCVMMKEFLKKNCSSYVYADTSKSYVCEVVQKLMYEKCNKSICK
jgi:hypothetical protein